MSPATPLGRPRLHAHSIGSTNRRAKELAAAGAPHGTIVTADEQTAGRGRHGRAWLTPAGESLALSVVVRWRAGSQTWERRGSLLPLAAGVAVAETVEEVLDGRGQVALKWPNDVWIDRRKTAGILVEGRPGENWAVIGIGVNVATGTDGFPEDLRERATSIAVAAGEAPSTEKVLGALLGRLSQWLTAKPADVLAAWRARDGLRGRIVRWSDAEGIAAGVDDSGALLVDTDCGGRLALSAGEVHLDAPV